MSGLAEVAARAGLKAEQAEEIFNAIMEHVLKGERVYIRGFGTFVTHVSAARTITSPKLPTGSVMVPARSILRFKPSPVTRVTLNPVAPAKAAKKSAKAEVVPAPAKATKKGAKVEEPVASAIEAKPVKNGKKAARNTIDTEAQA